MPEQAIHFDRVSKSFQESPAVNELTFGVPRGAIYGLLGPNGAGKTTSIRMIMAILHPDSGRIRVLGVQPGEALKDRIGYLPEERGLYQSMKVIDNLVFFGTIHGMSADEARTRARAWLERLAMSDKAESKLQELSKGNQQKIQFIATVNHDPDLLVLDEPFTGLDPVNQEMIRATILKLAEQGTTVILSTHLMDEVERLCSHLTLVDEGRALVEGKLADVKRRWGTDSIRIDVSGDTTAIESHPSVAHLSRTGRTLEVELEHGHSPSRFLSEIATRANVTRFEIRAPSLHSIFVRLVGAGSGAVRDETAPRPLARAATVGRGDSP